MRQELEAMVYQIYCPLTCPVYKWTQLHETILKSYPSGSIEDRRSRDYYQQWEHVPPGSARDAAMKNTFYELAVANPAAVEWYCSLRLEMAVHLWKTLLTQAMQSPSIPGSPALHARIQAELARKLGEEVDLDALPDLTHMGLVDDFYASFVWSDGGILHAHIALWMVGALE